MGQLPHWGTVLWRATSGMSKTYMWLPRYWMNIGSLMYCVNSCIWPCSCFPSCVPFGGSRPTVSFNYRIFSYGHKNKGPLRWTRCNGITGQWSGKTEQSWLQTRHHLHVTPKQLEVYTIAVLPGSKQFKQFHQAQTLKPPGSNKRVTKNLVIPLCLSGFRTTADN